MVSAQGKVVLGVVSVGTCNSPYCGRGCWFANSSRGCREGPDCKRCHNMDCALPADEERKANRKAKSRQRPSKKKRAKLALAYARATENGESPIKPPMNRQYLSAMKRLEMLRRSELATQTGVDVPACSPRDYGAVYRDLLSECLLTDPTSTDSSSLLSNASRGYLSPSRSDVSSFGGSTLSSSNSLDHITRDQSFDSVLGSSPYPLTLSSVDSGCSLPPSPSVDLMNGFEEANASLFELLPHFSDEELELELLLQESLSAACQQV
ncbi:hypothetical protein Pmar_PMAR020412 [Perkinsus marinus ATCC 50983]|uniref:Uncharacterized protein n=1 Tax=Perkinsus marinus (strain ATCC 50983 / TXsc) TaxID=423536 RepID=C5L6Z1_PERM5|nr:hypothetical protein Pmar_PMAR020412 [Perkinsus marinus ATCC 50983]EER07253.1 hypothetical protein Pmar_PMAR020412 [Perkinsus marinus ATCC 50983]|eukprot:XP_002775437.1 hypothetical protein Pmar_PMAR020412 [Perkinsus marinus ATCC 50983]